MRTIKVLTFMSLDGVMQSPGAPDEDTSDGFQHGGWMVGYFDELVGQEVAKEIDHPFDLLFGRKTHDIMGSHWSRSTDPGAEALNKATKYVVTSRPLSTAWKDTSVVLQGDVVEAIRELKRGSGPEIQVHGSASLIQTLLENDLVDELWLKIFPITIGSGRKLFAEGTAYAGFELMESCDSPSGVIIARYRHAGEVKSSGSVARRASSTMAKK